MTGSEPALFTRFHPTKAFKCARMMRTGPRSIPRSPRRSIASDSLDCRLTQLSQNAGRRHFLVIQTKKRRLWPTRAIRPRIPVRPFEPQLGTWVSPLRSRTMRSFRCGLPSPPLSECSPLWFPRGLKTHAVNPGRFLTKSKNEFASAKPFCPTDRDRRFDRFWSSRRHRARASGEKEGCSRRPRKIRPLRFPIPEHR